MSCMAVGALGNHHRTLSESSTMAAMINRAAIFAELLEIESLLQDDRLDDQDRFALHGAQQPSEHLGAGHLGPGHADVLPYRQSAERGRFPAAPSAKLRRRN